MSTFGGRLNRLFRDSAPPGGEPYSNAQVAAAINQRAGTNAITAEYIRRLRLVGGSNPSVDKAALIADFFGIPLDYFNLRSDTVFRAVTEELDRHVRQRQADADSTPPEVMAFARSIGKMPPSRRKRLLHAFRAIIAVTDATDDDE